MRAVFFARFLRFVPIVLLAWGFAGCDDTPTSPTDVPFTVTDLRAGTGGIALNGSLVLVNYTGWLYDPARGDNKGAMFDTSKGGTPFVFTIGAGQVIEGWDQGVTGMAVGGLRRLVIPPSLAYGDSRNGPIPPYATLIFEIELVALGDDVEE
jgi:FKBP-type peptidyl-prolyl cis-trans isomerase FkpA